MNPPTKDEIATLRAVLRDGSDEQLGVFLESYARGHIAGALIAGMSPATRAGFFATMRAVHPEASPRGIS